jgi:cell division transport system permease protein
MTTKPQAIIPPEAVALRTLTVTMAVMCYLAALAIGALLLIDRAVDAWSKGLSHEVTVQIRDVSGIDIERELKKAQKILSKAKGVTDAAILDRAASLKLLEPWIGKTALEDLPVPRLIRVTLDEKVKPDFAALEEDLKSSVQGASLDTHQRWATELTRMASSLRQLSWLILLLICASAVAMVSFATRSVLDANRRVVNVLHLVGARDRYIARLTDRRFITTGVFSGLIGVGLALATFFMLSLSGPQESNGLAAAANSLFYLPGEIPWTNYLALLAVPLVATVIALITARVTLMHMLKAVQ